MGSWAYGYIVLPASGLLLLALKYSLQVYFYQRLAASVQWLRVPIGLLAYLPVLSLFFLFNLGTVFSLLPQFLCIV
jgi:hypothetical protein